MVGGLTGSSNTENRREVVANVKETEDARVKQAAQVATLKGQRSVLAASGKSTAVVDAKIADAEQDLKAIRFAQGTQSVLAGDGPRINKLDITTGIGWIDRAIEHATRNPELTMYKLQSSAYKFSWALIPISLPFIWLLFAFRRDVGLYDHAIFATYSLSAMTLMVVGLSLWSAIGVWQGLVPLALFFFPPWHMYRQLKGTYAIGTGAAIWRTAVLILFAYTSALLFVLMLLAMGLSH